MSCSRLLQIMPCPSSQLPLRCWQASPTQLMASKRKIRCGWSMIDTGHQSAPDKVHKSTPNLSKKKKKFKPIAAIQANIQLIPEKKILQKSEKRSINLLKPKPIWQKQSNGPKLTYSTGQKKNEKSILFHNCETRSSRMAIKIKPKREKSQMIPTRSR